MAADSRIDCPKCFKRADYIDRKSIEKYGQCWDCNRFDYFVSKVITIEELLKREETLLFLRYDL